MPHADSAAVSSEIQTKSDFYASVNENLEGLLDGPQKLNWVCLSALARHLRDLSLTSKPDLSAVKCCFAVALQLRLLYSCLAAPRQLDRFLSVHLFHSFIMTVHLLNLEDQTCFQPTSQLKTHQKTMSFSWVPFADARHVNR